MRMRTEQVVLPSEVELRRVVEILISRSQWFAVTPYPDDEWEVCVKQGEGQWLWEL